ncbi:MAG: perosamine synthetase [Psychroserpens sp.]|jgi:perosamine synthetase
MSQQTSLPYQIVSAIHSVVGAGPVGLHEPTFDGNEWLYVKECLDSTFVSSVGKFVDRFEDDLTAYTGAKHVVAVVNGTAALHIALLLADVKANDEVLVPALTFIATANAISYCGAMPHFVDSEDTTLGIATSKLRDYLQTHTQQHSGQCVNSATGKVIRAMVPMHTFGHPGDINGLLAVAHDFNIAIVEDAAESLGSTYHGQHTGIFGLLGTLSFNGNKTITTGGGGAILTNSTTIARRAKHITTTAKLPHAWEFIHDEIGYNYRMPNLNAALGCAQLEHLPAKLIAKRTLFKRYQAAFASVEGAKLIAEPAECESNYWLQALMLNIDQVHQRDAILQAANEARLMSRPVWRLMHQLTPFAHCPRMDLATAELLAQRLINIPSSPNLLSNVE